ncbi:MAG: mitochondrial large ribosomal subunit protein uL15m, partial [Luteimonas sp.]|nr:mitochondrial large ribosomal subunit protein uL15m [Luteimonas sp.]
GFHNPLARQLVPLNVGQLQAFIDAGRLNPALPITLRTLHRAGVCRQIKDGVVLLGEARGGRAWGAEARLWRRPLNLWTRAGRRAADVGRLHRGDAGQPVGHRGRGGARRPPGHRLLQPPRPARPPAPGEVRHPAQAPRAVPCRATPATRARVPQCAALARSLRRRALPTRKRDWVYYTNPANRGYLAPMAVDGATPWRERRARGEAAAVA